VQSGRCEIGSKTKNTTNQTQTQHSSNTYGLGPQATSADITALRGMIANPNEVDPTIAYGYGRARQDLDNSYKSPMGAYTSAATRDAVGRSAGKGLNMEAAVATSAGRREAQDRAFQQQSYLAGLTAPQTVQTSGSSTGSISGTNITSTNPGVGSYISQGLGAGIGLL